MRKPATAALWRTAWGLMVAMALLASLLEQVGAAEEVARDEAVLVLDAPPGATLRVDGCPAAAQRPLRFGGLAKGRPRQVKVEVEFPGGAKQERTVLLQGGWRVRMPLRRARTTGVDTVPQFGHNHRVNAVAFSPDETYLVTGGLDNLAILWDASTGLKLRTFHGHSSGVNAVAFSPDGKAILTGSTDKTARIWDLQSGKGLRTFTGHTEHVTAVAFAAGGRQILTGSKNKTVILWDAATGQKLRTFAGSAEVTCLACSPDDKILAMGLAAKKLLLWNLATGEKTRSIDADLVGVTSLAFSPDGKQILTGGDDELVCLWDVSTGRKARNFRGHDGSITSVAFAADGKHVLSGSKDKTAIVWDVITGAKARVLKGPSGQLSAVALSRDGRKALVTTESTATLWDIPKGAKVRSFGGQADGIDAVAFAADGRQFRVGTMEGAGIGWHEGSGLKLWSLKNDAMLWSQVFSPDGKQILASAFKRECALWDPLSGNKLRSLNGSPATDALAFHPDGKQALTGTGNGAILWDVATGQKIRTFEDGDKQMVTDSVAFSPDGTKILVAAELGGTILWDAATGKKIRTFDQDAANIASALALFSPDGKQVLTNTSFGGAALWDVATGKKLVTFGRKSLKCAALSPDGALLAAWVRDDEIVVWVAATGQKISTLKGHTDTVTSLTFSPDGRRVLSGSRDGTARLWDLATGDELVQVVCINGGFGWLALTPQGLFDGSRVGREKVCFRMGDGLKVVAVDRFFKDFYRPGLLRAIWRGERPMPGVDFAAQTPPRVRIASPTTGGEVEVNPVTVLLEAEDRGGGVQTPWLRHNGVRIAATDPVERMGKIVRQKFLVSLIEGANALEGSSACADGSWESEPARIDLRYSRPVEKPRLFLITIGINRYPDAALALRFAASDAKAVHDLFRRRGHKMYRNVVPVLLEDDKATRDGIRAALRKAAQDAKAQDTLLVFLAGHGTLVGQRYYYLPADFRTDKDKPRETAIREGGLPDDELAELIGAVPVLKRVLILDTCNSGGAAALFNLRGRSVDALRGVTERMNRAQGMFVLAAAPANAEAKEPEELGHGILTYALLAGLRATTAGPLKDEGVSPSGREPVADVLGWLGFASGNVPRLMKRYYGREQDVQMSSSGTSFPILPLRD